MSIITQGMGEVGLLTMGLGVSVITPIPQIKEVGAGSDRRKRRLRLEFIFEDSYLIKGNKFFPFYIYIPIIGSKIVSFDNSINIEAAVEQKLAVTLPIDGSKLLEIEKAVSVEGTKYLRLNNDFLLNGNKIISANDFRFIRGDKSIEFINQIELSASKQKELITNVFINANKYNELETSLALIGKKDITNILVALDLL